MIRTVLGLVVIIASILWLPVWFQLGLFVLGVITLPYRLLLLIPALIADALYAPSHTIAPGHFKMTIMVGTFLLIWYLVVTKTRLGNRYVAKP